MFMLLLTLAGLKHEINHWLSTATPPVRRSQQKAIQPPLGTQGCRKKLGIAYACFWHIFASLKKFKFVQPVLLFSFSCTTFFWCWLCIFVLKRIKMCSAKGTLHLQGKLHFRFFYPSPPLNAGIITGVLVERFDVWVFVSVPNARWCATVL